MSGKNLIICCDGTNNEFGENNTNVVRLIQVLNRDPARQRLHYDPGVGTLPEPGYVSAIGKWLSKAKGLAFGAGLSSNIEEAYSYLMEYWEPDDRVFLFGFSRGAYSVRVLAALLHALGLLPRGNQNLLPYVMRLFKGSRRQRDNQEYWKIINEFRWTFARRIKEGDDDRRFKIHFLGVWDTVSSVGWVWNPVTYPYTRRNPSIDIIRHAVSLDERRWFFRQNLMEPAKRGSDEPPQDLIQLWFPGVHCDVGGGYSSAEGGLWQEPFKWMLEEAQSAGLEFDENRLAAALQRAATPPLWWSANPWTDGKHESLTWKWWIPEFVPKLSRKKIRNGSAWKFSPHRSPELGLFRHREVEDGEIIHWSALRRVQTLANYKPRNLSERFRNEITSQKNPADSLPYKR